MQKKRADGEQVLAYELAKDRRLGTSGPRASLDTSADPCVAPGLRAVYDEARDRLAAFLESRSPADHAAANQALEALLDRAPWLAPVSYHLGRLAEEGGELEEARARYDEAIDALPDFPEALTARAGLACQAGRWDDSRRDLDRALQLQPDSPRGRLLLARIHLHGRDPGSALREASLATELAPADPDIGVRAHMTRNLALGPAWARTSTCRTAHYRVRTDLPETRAREFAARLEAMRSVYARLVPLPGASDEPAEVLVFESAEGYHAFLDLSLGDRQEDTAGVFLPWFGYLLLYDDPDADRTLEVLHHEGFHQYLQSVLPGAPTWLDEGMAEYSAGTRIEGGRVVRTGLPLAGRLRNLRGALALGWEPIPWRELMTETRTEFYGDLAALRYAQAWSLVHFLESSPAGRARLARYLEPLHAGDALDEALEAAFGDELEILERDWRRHVESLEIPE